MDCFVNRSVLVTDKDTRHPLKCRFCNQGYKYKGNENIYINYLMSSKDFSSNELLIIVMNIFQYY